MTSYEFCERFQTSWHLHFSMLTLVDILALSLALSLSLSLSLPSLVHYLPLIKRDVDISGAFIKRLLHVAVLLCVQREARVEA